MFACTVTRWNTGTLQSDLQCALTQEVTRLVPLRPRAAGDASSEQYRSYSTWYGVSFKNKVRIHWTNQTWIFTKNQSYAIGNIRGAVETLFNCKCFAEMAERGAKRRREWRVFRQLQGLVLPAPSVVVRPARSRYSPDIDRPRPPQLLSPLILSHYSFSHSTLMLFI